MAEPNYPLALNPQPTKGANDDTNDPFSNN